MNSDKERIKEIQRCCGRILTECKEIKKAGFLVEALKSNLTFQESVLFNLIQIGENVNRLSEQFVEMYPEVPWHQIVGMRNVITHGYGSIDIEAIADTVERDIPALYDQCLNFF